jgi:hypothetical protein
MNVAAYVLLGDPAWLVPSIRSYYDDVTKIVASYDQNFQSWAGHDLGPEIRACIRLLRENDPDAKVVLLPGAFTRADLHPMVAETHQRQASVNAASQFGDWVLQLDTDEIVESRERLSEEIYVTERLGLDALEYPARWIYSHVSSNWFLERGTRRLRTWDAIPGPIAVRSGTTLRYCRQVDVACRRLRFSPAGDVGSIKVIDAILHFSMVRSPAAMRQKATTSGHAPDLDWSLWVRRWDGARIHPTRAILKSMVNPRFGTYRLARLPAHYDDDLVAEQILVGDPLWLRSDAAHSPASKP